MDEIDIALQYAKRKKRNRLTKNNIRRFNVRSTFYLRPRTTNSIDCEQSVIESLNSMNFSTLTENNSSKSHVLSCSTPIIHLNEQIVQNNDHHQSNDMYDHLLFNDIVQDKEKHVRSLHQHTSTDCLSFSANLVSFIRKANISKSHTEHLINLIQSSLPQPNSLPDSYSDMLNLLSVEDLFVKRIICITCKGDIPAAYKTCFKCANDKPQCLALVFDVKQEHVFTRTYDRLCTIINSYRQIFKQKNLDNEMNDIVYNRNYKTLCDSIDYPFISIILHLDGISLSKSNNQPMWILSCSIVELPPAIRNRRQNNIILSIWIGKQQPVVKLWLEQTFNQLTYLKSKGFLTRSGTRIMLKVFALIGDCPALSMALSHISHGGYYCCWYCKLEGVYVKKRMQYYYDKNTPIRDVYNFSFDSRKAQYLQTKINGRSGISIFSKILDIPLPKSVIADYLHTTLLGHAKKICIYLYKHVMKAAERKQLDQLMSAQQFPHFFNRKIRLLSQGHIKATEIRNFFLYCVLPMMRFSLDCNRMAHLALFVVGIRLLHGRRVFGETTADRANDLLNTFYRDHEIFYFNKQNFVLHLHTHFAEIYRDFGSLCNINTFSQEDIMGAVSKYKHGSRFWGDQIVFYLNIDFALKDVHQNHDPSSSISTSEGLFDVTTVPEELIEILPGIHQRFCNCHNVNSCTKFYRRLRNKQHIIYHSLAYKKKQSSVSYFIKYGSSFGSIVTFMSCNDKDYAVVKRHPIKRRFSDYLVSSPYYNILVESVDAFFFVLDKVSFHFDVVDIGSSMEMCIVVEEGDSLVVSPLSAYHEHD